MRFHKDDVVAHVRLYLAAAGLGQALDQCRGLIDEFGVVGIELEPVARNSREYGIKLVLVEPSTDAESSADALRRIMMPLLAKLELGEEYFELDEGERKTTQIVVHYPEQATKLLPGCEQLIIGVWMGDAVEDFYDTVESLDDVDEAEPRLDESELAELTELAREAHATKILLVADLSGTDGIAAREQIRGIAARANREFLVSEPIPGPNGTIRVEAMVGVSKADPDETLEEVIDALGLLGWQVVERRPHLTRAVWSPQPQPSTGITRMELRTGPDVRVDDR